MNSAVDRSEEHTSELQSHSEISYAVFCLKKKTTRHQQVQTDGLNLVRLGVWAAGCAEVYVLLLGLVKLVLLYSFFFFNDAATTEIYTLSYTLSLHDALPISIQVPFPTPSRLWVSPWKKRSEEHTSELQSHSEISYAVFCLKKKKNDKKETTLTTTQHIQTITSTNEQKEKKE